MGRGHLVILGISVFGLFGSPIAYARAYRELKIGPEWEFSNSQGRESTSEERYGGELEEGLRDKLLNHVYKLMKESPGELKTDKVGKNLYFELRDGSWILFDTDPAVVEVHSSPRTIKEYKKDYPILQKYVFKAAQEVGLDYSWYHEAGQIHFDFESAFGLGDGHYDYLLFRNFLFDFYNHPEIYLGVLDHDPMNAPGLNITQRKKLTSLIKKFERQLFPGEIRSISGEKLAPLIHAINSSVYKHPHYAALNLEHSVSGTRRFKMKRDGSFEIRSVAMRNLKEWIKIAELFEARINHIAEMEEPIALIPQENQPTRQSAINRFQKYVIEAGLSWKEYISVMALPYRQNITCSQALDSN